MKKTALALVAAAALVAVNAIAQDGGSAKGIYRDHASVNHSNGIAYRVMLAHGDEKREVPVTHSFHSGDRFKLQVKLKDSAYIYVLNRTFDGDPRELGEKGITVVREEDKEHHEHARRPYTQLFPVPGERPEKIMAGRFRDIPGDVLLRMDQNPGLEKLYVIISDHELNLQKMYAGAIRNGRKSGETADGEHHSDPEADSVDHLNHDLAEWASGTQTEGPEAGADDNSQKGIEPDTYAVGSRSNPIVVEVTLHHYGQ